MSCCCPWLSKKPPEFARLIPEVLETADIEGAILEPAQKTSGESSLVVRPLQPTLYLQWSVEQIRSVGNLLSKVLRKTVQRGDFASV